MLTESNPSLKKEMGIESHSVPVTPTSRTGSTDSSSSDHISETSSHYRDIVPEKETSRPIHRTISRASHGSGIGEYADVTQTLKRHQTGVSIATNATSDPAFEVDWEDDDKNNPQTWPLWLKGLIIATMSYGTTTVYVCSLLLEIDQVPRMIQCISFFSFLNRRYQNHATRFLYGLAYAKRHWQCLSSAWSRTSRSGFAFRIV